MKKAKMIFVGLLTVGALVFAGAPVATNAFVGGTQASNTQSQPAELQANCPSCQPIGLDGR